MNRVRFRLFNARTRDLLLRALAFTSDLNFTRRYFAGQPVHLFVMPNLYRESREAAELGTDAMNLGGMAVVVYEFIKDAFRVDGLEPEKLIKKPL